MFMMPGAGAGGGDVQRQVKRSITHLRLLPPPSSLPPVCEVSSPPPWGASCEVMHHNSAATAQAWVDMEALQEALDSSWQARRCV